MLLMKRSALTFLNCVVFLSSGRMWWNQLPSLKQSLKKAWQLWRPRLLGKSDQIHMHLMVDVFVCVHYTITKY